MSFLFFKLKCTETSSSLSCPDVRRLILPNILAVSGLQEARPCFLSLPDLFLSLAVSVLSQAPARLWIQFPSRHGPPSTEDPVAETQPDLASGSAAFSQDLIATALCPGTHD